MTGDNVTFGNKGDKRQQVLIGQKCVASSPQISAVIVGGLLLSIPGEKLLALSDARAV